MEIRDVSPSPPLWKCQAPRQRSPSKVLVFLLSLTFYLWCQENPKSWHFYFPLHVFCSSHCLLSPQAFYLIILTPWRWAGESIFFHKEIPFIQCDFLDFCLLWPSILWTTHGQGHVINLSYIQHHLLPVFGRNIYFESILGI